MQIQLPDFTAPFIKALQGPHLPMPSDIPAQITDTLSDSPQAPLSPPRSTAGSASGPAVFSSVKDPTLFYPSDLQAWSLPLQYVNIPWAFIFLPL